jgi:hypothetical protein
MMTISPAIQAIHSIFTRHDRKYCIFSVAGREVEFLYCNHVSRPLRSLIFGRNFFLRLSQLMEGDNLCIECGLGLSVEGGVSLDDGDRIEWHFSVDEANKVLNDLKVRLGDEGKWIELF